MTDARMPERYLLDRRIASLTDGEFRAYVTAAMFSASNRTEGVITHNDQSLLPHYQTMYATALVAAGLWEFHEDGYRQADWDDTQSTVAQLEATDRKRRQNRDAQARRRAKLKGVTDDVMHDEEPDVTGEIKGKARTGKDRQGEDLSTNHLPGVLVAVNSPQSDIVTDAKSAWGGVA